MTPQSELWQHGNTLKPADAQRIDAFRHELTRTELEAVELLCRRTILRFSSVPMVSSFPLRGVPLVIKSFGSKIIEKLK